MLKILIVLAVVAIAIIKRKSIFVKKHILPLIGLLVIGIILFVVFTSSTESTETLAWWIIGIVGAILIGIVLFKFKHQIKIPSMSTGTTTASASTPASSNSTSSGVSAWKICGFILICTVGLGWYLKHHLTTTKGEVPATVTVDPYAGTTIIDYGKAQPLKVGIKYRCDRANGQYVFTPYRKETHVSPPTPINDRWWYITIDKDDLVWVTKEILN
jgi:hypothetical protein